MARETSVVIRSDLSNELIPESKEVVMTLQFADGRRNKYELDISEAEAEAFIAKGGREIKRRGRRPGSRNKPKES